MPRYKPTECNGPLLLVVLSQQIQLGSIEFAPDHVDDHKLDLSDLDAKFNNDETSASVYEARTMVKIVLLAYKPGPCIPQPNRQSGGCVRQHPPQQAAEPVYPTRQ